MRRWVISRQGLALVLLVALPAATTGRLLLDAAWDMNVSIGVETDHATCSEPTHDHRICGLILSSPWSLPPVPAVLPIAIPASHTSHLPVIAEIGLDLDRLRLPRSPPLS